MIIHNIHSKHLHIHKKYVFNVPTKRGFSYDFLTIYDGSDILATRLRHLTGHFNDSNNLPSDTISTGPNMLLYFMSDSYESGNGFKIQYDAGINLFLININCIILFYSIFGTINVLLFSNVYLIVIPPTTTTTTTTEDPNDPCGPLKPIALNNYGSGYIISPNYPDPYPNEADCQWHISLKANQTLMFKILDFELEYR